MTQPPLSRQIQQLENELGVQLIDRTTRTVTLTPPGVAFLPDARRILQLAEGAAREKLPDVTLDLREMVTSVQLEGLMTGELDLGMARPPVKRLAGAGTVLQRAADQHV